jgi:homoserine dehydrogenase
MGVAEADTSHDIEGWDTATKTAVLANVLLGANIRPVEVSRTGIDAVRPQDVQRALRQGRALRLIGRGRRKGRKVTAKVAPELLERSDPMSTAVGTTNVLAIQTDTMKELTLVEKDPGVEQTAYALLSDLLEIARRQ